MKLKPLFFCAVVGACSSSQINLPRRQIFGNCIVDANRNELLHQDLQNFFRHPLPSNLDSRFPIRCNDRSVFFISSDGFLHGIHATSSSVILFDLFMTRSDIRPMFPNLSDYSISQNGGIILQFTDGSTRHFSIILD